MQDSVPPGDYEAVLKKQGADRRITAKLTGAAGKLVTTLPPITSTSRAPPMFRGDEPRPVQRVLGGLPT
jgi:hypothetical protein